MRNEPDFILLTPIGLVPLHQLSSIHAVHGSASAGQGLVVISTKITLNYPYRVHGQFSQYEKITIGLPDGVYIYRIGPEHGPVFKKSQGAQQEKVKIVTAVWIDHYINIVIVWKEIREAQGKIVGKRVV